MDKTKDNVNDPNAGAAEKSTETEERNSCGTGCSINRRNFLKLAGGSPLFLSNVGYGSTQKQQQDSFAQRQLHASHKIPVDKGLSDKWFQSLLETGAPEIHRGKALETIGMPIGGIATGQLYLLGDGTLGCWQIFNHFHPTGPGNMEYRYRIPEKPVKQGFAVVVETDRGSVLRKLDKESFSEVEFLGEYPIGRVKYSQEDFPVRVQMEAFSPFIPLNTKDSALPATVFQITVENSTQQTLNASLLGWLENAVCFHSKSGMGRSRMFNGSACSGLLHTVEEIPEEVRQMIRETIVFEDFEGDDYGRWQAQGEAFGKSPAKGTLPAQNPVSGFQGDGLVNSFLEGDETQGVLTSPNFNICRKFINFLVGGGNQEGQTCINLLVDGKVARTATGQCSEQLTWNSWDVSDLEGHEAKFEIVDKASGGWGHINIDQIEFSDLPVSAESVPLKKRSDYGSMALTLMGEPASLDETLWALGLAKGSGSQLEISEDFSYPVWERKGSGLMTPRVAIPPKSAHTFTFVLSWNEVFAASILTIQNRTLPAQVLATLDQSSLPYQFAGGFFMMIPALIFIFFVRNYLFNMWGQISK